MEISDPTVEPVAPVAAAAVGITTDAEDAAATVARGVVDALLLETSAEALAAPATTIEADEEADDDDGKVCAFNCHFSVGTAW